jgi:exonuclease SbcD
MLAHAYIENAKVGGPESGERELHMGQTYAVKPQRLPQSAQYIALGHVHNPNQPALKLTNAQYSGSLLQCDFGEAGQKKRVNVIDAVPGRKTKVESVELKSIRQLVNVGSRNAGVTLDELRSMKLPDPDTYAKVFVKVDRPLPGLNEQVRELVPNAVDVVVQQTLDDTGPEPIPQGLSPAEHFTAYYRSQYQNDPEPALIGLFNRLYEEATSETG